MTQTVDQAVAMIAERSGGVAPRLGIVLGSGLGEVVQLLDDPVSIDYSEIPGFPSLT